MLCSELFEYGRFFFFVICSASWPMASLSDCEPSRIVSLGVRDHWRSTNPTFIRRVHTYQLEKSAAAYDSRLRQDAEGRVSMLRTLIQQHNRSNVFTGGTSTHISTDTSCASRGTSSTICSSKQTPTRMQLRISNEKKAVIKRFQQGKRLRRYLRCSSP